MFPVVDEFVDGHFVRLFSGESLFLQEHSCTHTVHTPRCFSATDIARSTLYIARNTTLFCPVSKTVITIGLHKLLRLSTALSFRIELWRKCPPLVFVVLTCVISILLYVNNVYLHTRAVREEKRRERRGEMREERHRRKLLLGPGAQAPHFYDHGARLYDEPPTFVT